MSPLACCRRFGCCFCCHVGVVRRGTCMPSAHIAAFRPSCSYQESVLRSRASAALH